MGGQGRGAVTAMAASSSRSSRASASRAQGGEAAEQVRSPVPYRVGPLAYSPAVLCQCRRKTPCWTAWSNENPGRRYYRCPAGMVRKFGFLFCFC